MPSDSIYWDKFVREINGNNAIYYFAKHNSMSLADIGRDYAILVWRSYRWHLLHGSSCSAHLVSLLLISSFLQAWLSFD